MCVSKYFRRFYSANACFLSTTDHSCAWTVSQRLLNGSPYGHLHETTTKKHEDIKKRAYGQRVRDVECGVFTPLVFSTTGGMGREATTFYKRLADMLAWKQQTPYPVVISWIRCKLSFAAVRSSIMCIRGTRSSINRPLRDADITLATSEGGIPQDE